jgi:hypothetical protein
MVRNDPRLLIRAAEIERSLHRFEIDRNNYIYATYKAGGRHVYAFSKELQDELADMDVSNVPCRSLEFLPYNAFVIDVDAQQLDTRLDSNIGPASIRTQFVVAIRTYNVYDGENGVGWDMRDTTDRLKIADYCSKVEAVGRADGRYTDFNVQPGWTFCVCSLELPGSDFIASSGVGVPVNLDESLSREKVAKAMSYRGDLRSYPGITMTTSHDETERLLYEAATRAMKVAFGGCAYLAQDKPSDVEPVGVDFGRKKPTAEERRATKHSGKVTAVGFKFAAERRKAAARQGSVPAGHKVSAHVRRAHWHSVRCGPGKQDVRVLFYSPIIVNGTDFKTGVVHR